MNKLIDSVPLPEGLRSLPLESLAAVVDELRDELIETVSLSGGHFASSLGAAELTVMLHYLFQTPLDKIIWDTGHQGYIHKMLTGRRDHMHSIRKKGGISGFLRRTESEFDAFGAGHAGTSISAAVGMAVALRRTDPSRHVVAVIGDGSLTAGMAFEALNHAGDLGLSNLIVILNDNEMSISPNVGAISWLFSRAVTSKFSTKARSGFKELYRRGYVPEFVYKAVDRAEEAAQGFFATPSMLFESFGFRYIGPIDGHNLEELHTTLSNAKGQDVPVLIHARTRKGKGFERAEDDPITWHAVKPFDREEESKNLIEIHSSTTTSETQGEADPVERFLVPAPKTYTSAFAQTVAKLIKQDKDVVAITAAMAGGTGLDSIAELFPQNFFDVGICEQHAVTFAAGLACEGYLPIVAVYSTFLQRAYDQVLHDVCIQNLPIIFALDRAGAVGNDGETHQGLFDISYLRSIPGIVLMAPADENELQHMFYTALSLKKPVAIRYPRGNCVGVRLDQELRLLPIGQAEVRKRGEDVLFLCYGPTLQSATFAAQKLNKEYGLTSTVVNARFAKPLDLDLLKREIPQHRLVCTLEDNMCAGGFGSAVLEACNDSGLLNRPIERFGAGDIFVPHATQAEQYKLLGYDVESIVDRVSRFFVKGHTAASMNGSYPSLVVGGE
jgi:1-deoxy-D-xylulose-5-phosphate synthase